MDILMTTGKKKKKRKMRKERKNERKYEEKKRMVVDYIKCKGEKARVQECILYLYFIVLIVFVVHHSHNIIFMK